MSKGYSSHDGAGATVSRRRFLEYLFLQAPLCAWWLSRLREVHAQTGRNYTYVNGGCLIANHHEFLFTNEFFWDQMVYYIVMGVKVIRAMATDANHLIPGRELNGAEVGGRIALIAPALRMLGIKLMVALTNNHCPVPGDDKYAGIRPQVGDPSRSYYEILEPWFEGGFRENYLPFVEELITTVKKLGAADVIFAWEPGNELHTPSTPATLLDFYKEVTAFIKDLDPDTKIASGTMGVNHIDPGQPDSPVVQEIYRLPAFDIITLHTYDFILRKNPSTDEYDKPVSPGDMPIDWDFQLLKAMDSKKPVIVEEIGTTRTLAPWWYDPGALERLIYEARLIDYTLVNGALGWGPWSLTTQGERIGDGYRGPCSYPGMSLWQTNGEPTDSPRARLEECYRNLPQAAIETIEEKFPHLQIWTSAAG